MTPTAPLLRRIAAYLAILIAAAGMVIIAGWQFRIPVLKGVALGTFVAPNTGLVFTCCGASVLLQLCRRRVWQVMGAALGAFVTCFAAATVLEYAAGIDLGIDSLFMAHRLSDWTLPLPGRFALNTAVGFLVAGLSLLTLRRDTGKPVSEFFALVLLLVSYLSLVGYLYGASSLYDYVMALHTAVLFGLLAATLLCAASRQAFMAILLSPFAVAIASRKMIGAIVMLLPSFGFIELGAERLGVVSLQLGTALAVVATVTVFTMLAMRTAAVLNETDRKRVTTEEALLRSRQIEAAGRMAASVAHEINNPLEAVGNLIYLLKDENLPQETKRKYLAMAEEELNRVATLARRTLGFYKEATNPTDIDVPELVGSVLDMYRDKLTTKAKVHRSFAEKARIIAKAGEIRQVIANLVANAADALPDAGGLLEVAVENDGQFVIIVIRDNGHGIASHDLERIFEPFFTTKTERGTGLGLWVSQDLILKNGGNVRVSSSTAPDDHGTTFRLSFPAAQPKEETSGVAKATAESA